jgi:hypothetical protein
VFLPDKLNENKSLKIDNGVIKLSRSRIHSFSCSFIALEALQRQMLFGFWTAVGGKLLQNVRKNI